MNVHDKIMLRIDAVWDIRSLAQTALDDSNHFIEEKGGKPATCIRELPDRIANLPGGGNSTINGRAFDCGTFSLQSDQTTNFTINHSLGAVPSAFWLYIIEPPAQENGANIKYKIGAVRTNSESSSFSLSLHFANGVANGAVGAAANANRIEWTDTTVQINASTTYPLRAGLTYEWIALGGIA